MNIELVKNLTMLPTHKVYNVLVKFLYKHGYKRIERQPHFIMAEGLDPVCLIAHMDTVFNFQPEKEDFLYDAEKQVLWSPYGTGFDDRAGIAGIIELVMRGHRPHIIFTDLEEVGGIGARELINAYPHCPFKNCKALIELEANEDIQTIYSIYRDTDAKYVLFVTKNGLVKKTALSEYIDTKKSNGIGAINIKENDALAVVTLIKEEPLIIITKNGYSLVFKTNEIPVVGLKASGVKSIGLGQNHLFLSFHLSYHFLLSENDSSIPGNSQGLTGTSVRP